MNINIKWRSIVNKHLSDTFNDSIYVFYMINLFMESCYSREKKGGNDDENFSIQSYFVKKKNG